MYTPSLKEFLKLSRAGNAIPVYKEINADLDTPVSAFLKIKGKGTSFLFESVEGQEKIARYSFLGSDSSLVFKSKGRNVEINFPHKKSTRRFVAEKDPLDEIEKIMRAFKAVRVKGLPRFSGGLVGYFAYDFVRFFEDIPDNNADDLKLPDAIFLLTNNILVFDHINHTIKIISNVLLPGKGRKSSLLAKRKAYSHAVRQIEDIHAKLKKPSWPIASIKPFQKMKFFISTSFSSGINGN